MGNPRASRLLPTSGGSSFAVNDTETRPRSPSCEESISTSVDGTPAWARPPRKVWDDSSVLAHTDTGSGAPVVLLHGLTCNAAYWLRVVPLLFGLRAIALDFGGHGLSEHRDSYAYADYERDLFQLLDEFGLDRVAVAGHSLGGYVALLAATRSDRIGAVLAIDVKSDWTDADAELAERSRDAAQRVEPDRAALVDRLARTLQPVVPAPDELELLAERSIEPAAGGWRFRWDRRVLATEPVDPFAFLSDVSCPAQVMGRLRERRHAARVCGEIRRGDPRREARGRRRRRAPRRARGSGARRSPDSRARLAADEAT